MTSLAFIQARFANNGGHAKRISKEQRREILRLYDEAGLEAAQRVAAELGLAARYVERLTRAMGMA